MADDHLLLTTAEQNYRQAKDVLATGRRAEAIVLFHAGLESLLRWALIRDGADPAPGHRPQPRDLERPHRLPGRAPRRGARGLRFLGQMTALRDQLLAGATPQIQDLHMRAYAQLVAQLYRRFFPRGESERAAMAQRATFARRQPVDQLTSMPPERARDTRVVVPERPALTSEPQETPEAVPAPEAEVAQPAESLPSDYTDPALDTEAANWGPLTAVRPDSEEEQRRRARKPGGACKSYAAAAWTTARSAARNPARAGAVPLLRLSGARRAPRRARRSRAARWTACSRCAASAANRRPATPLRWRFALPARASRRATAPTRSRPAGRPAPPHAAAARRGPARSGCAPAAPGR